MASIVGICNSALQKLGSKRITSITEDTPQARACNAAFETVRDAELRAHPWSFAVKRVSLAADSEAPAFVRTNAFTLPADFIRLIEQDPEVLRNSLDWQVEGRKIITHDSAPLEVRYIYQVTDPNLMDALFIDAFAVKLAIQLCEELTQSNTKKAELKDDYRTAIRDAKRANAFERVAQQPPEDTWVTCRR